MKKIGILTFHKSINYGSALQAFALLEAIKVIVEDTEVEIIDYQQRKYNYIYGIYREIQSLGDIKNNIGNTLFFNMLRKRKNDFCEFREKYLNLSKKKYQYGDDLSGLSKEYKCIICGSDQIWNPSATDFDINYFLPIPNCIKKIAYAVSLNSGNLEDAENVEEIRKRIKEFDQLAVREVSGKDKLENFLHHKDIVSVVLDPTLLHEKEFYQKISTSRFIVEPYIFFYSVNYTPYAIKAAEILSERTGLPVYTLYSCRSVFCIRNLGGKIKIWKKNIGPKDFLSLIQYADHVVTNSFHGTAFSLIFQKNFYAIGKSSTEEKVVIDERICNILGILGIQKRFLTYEDIKSIPIKNDIDYKKVTTNIKILSNESIRYIKNALFTEGGDL